MAAKKIRLPKVLSKSTGSISTVSSVATETAPKRDSAALTEKQFEKQKLKDANRLRYDQLDERLRSYVGVREWGESGTKARIAIVNIDRMMAKLGTYEFNHRIKSLMSNEFIARNISTASGLYFKLKGFKETDVAGAVQMRLHILTSSLNRDATDGGWQATIKAREARIKKYGLEEMRISMVSETDEEFSAKYGTYEMLSHLEKIMEIENIPLDPTTDTIFNK